MLETVASKLEEVQLYLQINAGFFMIANERSLGKSVISAYSGMIWRHDAKRFSDRWRSTTIDSLERLVQSVHYTTV